MAEVTERNEVALYGVRYPIDGKVTEQSLNAFAPKTVIGDATRSDQVLVSQFIMNDWRDGAGIYSYAESDTVACFYESTAETRIKGQLRLPRYQYPSTELGDPLDEGINPSTMISWGTRDYVSYGSIVYQQTAAGTAFVPYGTAGASITDMAVYMGGLFVAAGMAGYQYYLGGGTAWTTVSGTPCYKFTQYDNKLIALTRQSADGLGRLLSTTTGNPTLLSDWTTNALIGDPVADVKSLDTYVNSEGRDAIYAFTKWGVRVVDFATQAVYYPRALQFPDGSAENCRAFCVSYGGGEGYLGVKQIVYRLSGQNIYPMDMTQEKDTTGGMHEMVPRANIPIPNRTPRTGFLLEPAAGLSRLGTATVQQLVSTERFIVAAMSRNQAFFTTSAILAHNGRGWHSLVSASGPITVLHYSTGSPLGPVLWFNTGKTMKYIKLPDVSDNPYLYTVTNVETSASHTTSWFDGNYAEVDKLAVALNLRKRGSNGTVVVSYGLDYDDATWNAFATVTAAGGTVLPFNSGYGTVFGAIRFKYDLSTSNSTIDTVMDFGSLKYALVPDKIRGWRFTADCSHGHGDKTAEELVAALRAAEDTKTLGILSFEPNSDHFVKVQQLVGKVESGEFQEGKFDVLVAELT